MTLTSLFSETHDYNRLAMHNNPLMGEGYNLPAFITMSIMQSMVASRMSALGQSDLPPKSGDWAEQMTGSPDQSRHHPNHLLTAFRQPFRPAPWPWHQ